MPEELTNAENDYGNDPFADYYYADYIRPTGDEEEYPGMDLDGIIEDQESSGILILIKIRYVKN